MGTPHVHAEQGISRFGVKRSLPSDFPVWIQEEKPQPCSWHDHLCRGEARSFFRWVWHAEVRPGRSFRWVWHARQPQLCAPVKEAFLAPQACRNFRDLTQIFISEVKTLRSMDSKGLTEVMSCVGVWLSLGSLSFELGPSPGEFPSFGPRARNLSLPSVWGEECVCVGGIRAGGKSESQ